MRLRETLGLTLCPASRFSCALTALIVEPLTTPAWAAEATPSMSRAARANLVLVIMVNSLLCVAPREQSEPGPAESHKTALKKILSVSELALAREQLVEQRCATTRRKGKASIAGTA